MAIKISGSTIIDDSRRLLNVGLSTFSDDVSIADKIVHTGDTDTAVRFPAANTVTVETAGSERLRVRSNGVVAIGTDESTTINSSAAQVQIFGAVSDRPLSLMYAEANSSGPQLNFAKGRDGDNSASTAVNSGDLLGSLHFAGADGSDFNSVGAEIVVKVDGTPGSNDMPGRIEFKTTSDGASTTTERLRISADGTCSFSGEVEFKDDLRIYNGEDIFFYVGDTGTSETASIFAHSGGLNINQLSGDFKVAVTGGNSDGDCIMQLPTAGNFVVTNNGVEKLNVNSSGINVTGISTLGLLKVQGSVDTVTLMHQYAGASEVHFKSLSSAQAIDYTFFGASNHKIADLKDGGSVDLYYDSNKKFETTSAGVTVSGIVSATTFSGSGASLTNLPASTTITVTDESSDTTCFPLFVTAATGDLAPKSGSNLTFNSSTGALTVSGRIESTAAAGPFKSNTTLNSGAAMHTMIESAAGATNKYFLYGTANGVQTFDVKTNGALTATSLSSGDTLTVSGITNLNNDVIFDGTSYNASWDKSANTFNFADNAKATFGDGGDLKIYHNGSVNYLAGDEIRLVNNAVSESMAKFIADGAVELYYNDIKKFETKSDGVDITGELQCDTLDVDGAANIQNVLTMQSYIQGTGPLDLYGSSSASVGLSLATDGNITIPDKIIHASDTDTAIRFPAANTFTVETAGSERLRVTSAGDVGIGSTQPTTKLDVNGGVNVTGVVTATSFAGDGSALTGIAAGGGGGEFNTGITSTVQATPLSFETTIHTFPSTSGRQYVIESINVANVDESVGVGTTVNIIASIQDATAGEQTYIAYNVPIVTGGVIELLKNPIVAGPSDVIRMWTTNDDYVGVNNAADVYINYAENESTDFISKFASNTTINSTSAVTLYTSTSNPTMIEKIGFANRTDTGDFPVSIKVTSGTTTSYLAKNLIIPRYSTVDILDRPKRIETDAKIEVEVGSTGTIDVIIAGKKITS